MTNFKKLPEESQIVASVIYSTGESKLYYDNQALTATRIAGAIKEASEEGKTIVEIGKNDILISLVWCVKDWKTEELIVINEENAIPPITQESMQKMDNDKLYSTLCDLVDLLFNSDLNDEQYAFMEMLGSGIDETEERLVNERYDKECVVNIFNTFINEYSLNELFEKHLRALKFQQQNENDEYDVAKEMYGDLRRFRTNYYWDYK